MDTSYSLKMYRRKKNESKLGEKKTTKIPMIHPGNGQENH